MNFLTQEFHTENTQKLPSETHSLLSSLGTGIQANNSAVKIYPHRTLGGRREKNPHPHSLVGGVTQIKTHITMILKSVRAVD